MKIFTVAFPDEFDPIAEQIEQLRFCHFPSNSFIFYNI